MKYEGKYWFDFFALDLLHCRRNNHNTNNKIKITNEI